MMEALECQDPKSACGPKGLYHHPRTHTYMYHRCAEVQIYIYIYINTDAHGAWRPHRPIGIYDSCFYVGLAARTLCAGRNLGPTPEPGLQCPRRIYDKQFLNSQGGIIG